MLWISCKNRPLKPFCLWITLWILWTSEVMDVEWKNLVYQGAARDNVLHLTSACPLGCVFCSHAFNPEGVEIFAPGALSRDMARELLEFLQPGKTVRMGESTSRVLEGEPFSHPQIFPILEDLRKKHGQIPVEIVTAGLLQVPQEVDRLQELGSVSLKLSLNILPPPLRRELMGPKAGDIRPLLSALQERGIPFSLTLVAQPHKTGWRALRDSIVEACAYGPRDITLFRPAWTQNTPASLRLRPGDEEKLKALSASLQSQVPMPLLLEPPELKDLQPVLAGVYPQSPCGKVGLKRGDILRKIGDMVPRSRREAYDLLYAGEGPLPVWIEGSSLPLSVEKEGHSFSGAVFHRDLPGDFPSRIEKAARGKACGLITSMAVSPLMESILPAEIRVLPVEHRKFGGSIQAVGLLALEDVLQGVKGRVEDLDRLFVPAVMLDPWGRDLWGVPLSWLEKALGLEILALEG